MFPARTSAGRVMEHRGVDFIVVQTLSPPGWKWTVKTGQAERAGMHRNRSIAIRRAKKCIDELIGKHGPSHD